MREYGTGSVYEHRPGYYRAVTAKIKLGDKYRIVSGYGKTAKEALKERDRKVAELLGRSLEEIEHDQRQSRTTARSGKAAGATNVGAAGPSPHTVEAWLSYWIDHAELTPKSRQGYESKVKLYITPVIGSVPLSELTTEQIETIYDRMRLLGLSQNTIAQTHRILRRALTVAVKRRHLQYNPAEPIERVSAEHRPMPTLTAEQARKVLEVAKGHGPMLSVRMICAFVLALGQGDTLALQWDDVHEDDPEGPYLDIEQSLTRAARGRGRGPRRTGTKDRVPLPGLVVDTFAQARKQAKGPWVFPGRDPKHPISASGDNHRFHRILEEAGVPDIPLHGARGTAASVLADLGVPLTTVALILRHKDVATTVKHYARADQAMAKEGLNRLAKEWKQVF